MSVVAQHLGVGILGMENGELSLTLHEGANEVVATWGFVRFAVGDAPDDAQLKVLGEKLSQLLAASDNTREAVYLFAQRTGYVDLDHIQKVMIRVLDYADALKKLTSSRDAFMRRSRLLISSGPTKFSMT